MSKALNGKIEGASDAGVALAVIAGCMAVPHSLHRRRYHQVRHLNT